MESTFMPTTSFQVTTEAAWSNESLLWILITGFIIAFVLAFAVGANDVANSFGTAVGAKVLTLKQACVLATIFETAGAVLLGAKVGETIRKGIIDVTVYDDVTNGVTILMLGELSAMFGSAVWQLVATRFRLPVSGTHSIVGSCIGFSLVAVGSTGVNWPKLGLIVASWFISPVLSGGLTVLLFLFVNYTILAKENPLKNGLLLLPFFYAITIGINTFSIVYSGAPLLGLDHLPVWASVLISLGFALLTGVLVVLLAVPRIRSRAKTALTEYEKSEDSVRLNEKLDNRFDDSGYQTPNDKNQNTPESSSLIEKVCTLPEETEFRLQLDSNGSMFSRGSQPGMSGTECTKRPNGPEAGNVPNTEIWTNSEANNNTNKDVEIESTEENEVDDGPAVRELFSSLQVLTACFASFAHGGNDVSNAIGPLIALWIVFWSGEVVQKAFTPWYLLMYGGFGICIGLWLLGRRVIETIGSNLTKVTPSRGFCIELMTALTVLVASNVGLPVSTTHCKVGSVVSIGWFRSRSAVDWSLVGNIAVAWFVTVPVSGLLSAGVMWVLMQVAL
uniref:sodium-dependent phosphate transporter 1-A-like n=1 Tax=Ciona intestinalis TaxID=7719 RepID=UPI000180B17C|nr:sodium-dependent phosphate transporter 1-A-like [Ciona intestinalis]|eukprot:XP_002125242.1 sodium-dependent phosphate transporter 1-A-like [Ciona intestinalis]